MEHIQNSYINGLLLYPTINNEVVKNAPVIKLTKHETLVFLNKTELIIIDDEHATTEYLSGATFTKETTLTFFNEHLSPIFLELVSTEKKESINQIFNLWLKDNVDNILFEFIHHYMPLSPKHIEMMENDSNYIF
jgi:hypothetical protein